MKVAAPGYVLGEGVVVVAEILRRLRVVTHVPRVDGHGEDGRLRDADQHEVPPSGGTILPDS